MGKKLEESLLQRGYPKSQPTHEKVLNLFDQRTMQIKTLMS